MAEWLVEEGIAEHRAISIRGGDIVAARIDWPGMLASGHVEDAVLVSRTSGSARGTALFANGEEALVDKLPVSAKEGAPIRLEIIRASIREQGRRKYAQSRPTDKTPGKPPTLAKDLRREGHEVKVVRTFLGRDWEELWLEAWHGTAAFAGGELTFFDTPAMVLVDIDGPDDPRQLALNAVRPLASAIKRMDLSGNIGIDFPTLPAKADRKAVDAELAGALSDWQHERTAMNGFGFVQLVARRQRPSLLNRITVERVGAAARLLLRKAEQVSQPGAVLLTCNPVIKRHLKQSWLDELAKRTGREVRIETDSTLALEGGFAQSVPL